MKKLHPISNYYIEKVDDVLKFFRFLKKVIDILTIVITLLNFFLKINNVQELLSNTIFLRLWNSKFTPWIIVVVFALFVILGLINLKFSNTKTRETSEIKHQFFHELRDFIFVTMSRSDKDKKSYHQFIREGSEKMCRTISDYFVRKYNKNFNFCIKMIDIPSSRTSSSINEIRVTTLCRGGKDKLKREKMDNKKPVLVSEDTSYYKILSNDDKCRRQEYICTNLFMKCLLSKASSEPYLPPFKTFCKKYLSTIVVPIRVETEKLPDNHRYASSNDNAYQVFGFLCMDYKFPISKNMAKQINEDLKAFADGLYVVYDEVIQAEDRFLKATN